MALSARHARTRSADRGLFRASLRSGNRRRATGVFASCWICLIRNCWLWCWRNSRRQPKWWSMSWKKCASFLEYPLEPPRSLVILTFLLHSGVWFSTLSLALGDEVLVAMWLLIWRSWTLSGRQTRRYQAASLRVEHTGRLTLLNFAGRDRVATRKHRIVRFPGFSSARFVLHNGKPLEILIFCRYDRRRGYRRLVRHLQHNQDLSTTGFVQ